jgi:hypothetical protein
MSPAHDEMHGGSRHSFRAVRWSAWASLGGSSTAIWAALQTGTCANWIEYKSYLLE